MGQCALIMRKPVLLKEFDDLWKRKNTKQNPVLIPVVTITIYRVQVTDPILVSVVVKGNGSSSNDSFIWIQPQFSAHKSAAIMIS